MIIYNIGVLFYINFMYMPREELIKIILLVTHNYSCCYYSSSIFLLQVKKG